MLRRTLSITGIASASLLAIVLLLLCYPKSLFAHSLSIDGLTLYSDRPFTDAAGTRVLKTALAKLKSSPLYKEDEKHSIFVCNSDWRQRIFFTYAYGVGGVNYYPLTANIFLRDADIETNRLIGPSRKPLAPDRPLDYFIVHEITHTLTGRAVGGIGNKKLPQWVREGYADYVAKGATFDYDAAVSAFIANQRAMDYEKSGLYLRFNLLVARLLDKEGWTVERLLNESIEQEDVENAIRANAVIVSK